MPQNDANFEGGRPDSQFDDQVDAADLFEQLLEAEIMGDATYGADPDLDLIEQRLSQLRQGPEPTEVVAETVVEPEQPIQSVPLADVVDCAALPLVPPVPMPPAMAPRVEPAAARPSAPPVVVPERRTAALPKPTSSPDTVVLEAARAAGVAPAYLPPTAATRRPAPAAAVRRRSSRLPSFYFAVLALLLVSFALFAVWRPVYDEVINLSDGAVAAVAEATPHVPALPASKAPPEASVDPQLTASVGDTPAGVASADVPVATTREGYAARRVVKLYRVDAQGNIIGLPSSP